MGNMDWPHTHRVSFLSFHRFYGIYGKNEGHHRRQTQQSSGTLETWMSLSVHLPCHRHPLWFQTANALSQRYAAATSAGTTAMACTTDTTRFANLARHRGCCRADFLSVLAVRKLLVKPWGGTGSNSRMVSWSFSLQDDGFMGSFSTSILTISYSVDMSYNHE